ncbi:hypothetical protein TeGR_g14807 [Tetraparma gracilis]|uniref:OTU domain-containing protein n=1 Tax=Tetraparma gracilis TaxID=2962635 RepID=A0ABQ6MS35_9STRA|nr:hypothetical protein TeGR_g14807 [Tetraparma gracilis]
MAKKKTTTKEGVAKKQQKPLPQPPLPPLPPLPPVLSRAAQDKIMLPRMTWTESGSTTLAFAAGKMKVLADRAKKRVAAERSNEDDDDSMPPTPRSIRRQKSVEVKENKRLLSSRLAFLRLAKVKMASDGNCLFRACSHELFGTQAHHLAVRLHAVEWMRRRPEVYQM